MNIHDFLCYYFTVALVVGIIILLILVILSTSESEKYTKRENFVFYILTALTAVAWPILIIYLFYLNHKDKDRITKNKRMYKKYRKYFMNAQIVNSYITKVLNFIEALYYAPDDIKYENEVVSLIWHTDNGSRMKIICKYDDSADIIIIPYYNFIKKDQDMINKCKIQKSYYYIMPADFKAINRIVENFVDKVYDDNYKGDQK